jgi:hypothetical protein
MANQESGSRASRRFCAGYALVFVAVTAFLGFRFNRMLEPADRVFVSVNNIDPSTRSLYFVAETPSGSTEMPWYLEKVTPFTMNPSDCTATTIDPKRDGTSVTRAVQWIDGRRYGLVVGYEEGPLRVFWFKPDEIHLRWNSWLRGGGEALIELPEKEMGEEMRL